MTIGVQTEAAGARPAVRPIATTAAYFAGFVALGLMGAAIGPTLPALAEQTGIAITSGGILLAAPSVGYLLGSLLAGWAYDRVAGHAVMVVALLTMAAMISLAPLVSFFWLLAGVLLITGIGQGLLDVGGNTLLVWVHQRKVGPFMQALHFFFALGAVLSPLIIAQVVLLSGGIRWAYWVLALLVLPVALALALLRSPPAPHTQPETTVQVHKNTTLALLVALFMLLFVGAEVSFGGWIYTYAVETDLANVTTAAYLTALFWGGLMLGRLVAIPFAALLRPRILLLIDLIGAILSVALILTFSGSPQALWIGTFGSGFFQASIFATVITWAERRMTITGRVTSIFFVGVSIGSIAFPLINGWLFGAFGPEAIIFGILCILIAGLIVFGVLMWYGGPAKMDEMQAQPVIIPEAE